ncbi:MAG: hypothetical protein IIC70_07605 [Acidobacteria bacterium]|nr:hypothetical protein [Acidobacteriota bacterium]
MGMTAAQVAPAHDPYGGCEGSCTHDLARGVLVSELLGQEGPYPDSHPLLTPPNLRTLFTQGLAVASGTT